MSHTQLCGVLSKLHAVPLPRDLASSGSSPYGALFTDVTLPAPFRGAVPCVFILNHDGRGSINARMWEVNGRVEGRMEGWVDGGMDRQM